MNTYHPEKLVIAKGDRRFYAKKYQAAFQAGLAFSAMSEKRRSARIQGGWAPKRITKPGNASNSKKQKESEAESNASTKTVFQQNLNPEKQLVFKPTATSVKTKAPVRIIDCDGEYELSNGPNGVSKIILFKGFIDSSETKWMFEQLSAEVPWQEKEIMIFGKKMMQPRLIAWFGDFPYTYSRQTLNPFKWSPLLNILREKIEQKTGYVFNSLLANFYRDNKDSVDWHSDDEKSLGKNPIIASLSFGDTRMFEMKRRPVKEGDEDEESSPKIKVPLTDGSLLLMLDATQHDWLHRVGKEYHHRDPRINLTFRTIYPK
eukprot:Seg779.5 transcript_id=Seg779.5/GoldUCD/mRNA.D3Y31 product="alpha-ketoglutarate-dependent dioxygenase alkB 3" protein_id=Seg779.5/GoldUCD/D3Y31